MPDHVVHQFDLKVQSMTSHEFEDRPDVVDGSRANGCMFAFAQQMIPGKRNKNKKRGDQVPSE